MYIYHDFNSKIIIILKCLLYLQIKKSCCLNHYVTTSGSVSVIKAVYNFTRVSDLYQRDNNYIKVNISTAS